jgi:Holliday junction resolvase RusA-like endonuclease
MSLHNNPFFIATLPLPPSINASYKVVSGHRRLSLSHEAAQFKQEAAWVLKHAEVEQDIWQSLQGDKSKKRKTPLEVKYHFFFKTMWRRDVDGAIKIVQDVVFEHLGLNDNLVVHLDVWKSVSDEPRVEISVSILVAEEAA